MSLIYRDERITELAEDVDYIKSLINDEISNVQVEIDNIQAEQITQNTAISNHGAAIATLQSQAYPESVRNLRDVDVTPEISEDQKVLYYDYAADLFKLKEVDNNGIGDVADSNSYV